MSRFNIGDKIVFNKAYLTENSKPNDEILEDLGLTSENFLSDYTFPMTIVKSKENNIDGVYFFVAENHFAWPEKYFVKA